MSDSPRNTITSRIWCPMCRSLSFKITYTTIVEPMGVSEDAMHIKCTMTDWEAKCVRPTCGYTMKKEEDENEKSEGRS